MSCLHWNRLDEKTGSYRKIADFLRIGVRQHYFSRRSLKQIEKRMMIYRIVEVQTFARRFPTYGVWRIYKKGSRSIAQIFRDYVKGIFVKKLDLALYRINCSDASCECFWIPATAYP